MAELQQFAGHDFIQAVNAGDSVTQGDDGAHFVHGNLGFVIFNLIADELCYFVCFYLSHKSCFSFKPFFAEVLRLACARSGSRQQALSSLTPANRLDFYLSHKYLM